MAEAITERKTEGRYHNRTRLNVLVMSAQYTELRRVCNKCELSITDAVGEALQIWINKQREMGV